MPNVIVLGDIRRLLSQAAAVVGDVGNGPPGVGGEPGAWNLRAPNVLASHVDTPQEVTLHVLSVGSLPGSGRSGCKRLSGIGSTISCFVLWIATAIFSLSFC